MCLDSNSSLVAWREGILMHRSINPRELQLYQLNSIYRQVPIVQYFNNITAV